MIITIHLIEGETLTEEQREDFLQAVADFPVTEIQIVNPFEPVKNHDEYDIRLYPNRVLRIKEIRKKWYEKGGFLAWFGRTKLLNFFRVLVLVSLFCSCKEEDAKPVELYSSPIAVKFKVVGRSNKVKQITAFLWACNNKYAERVLVGSVQFKSTCRDTVFTLFQNRSPYIYAVATLAVSVPLYDTLSIAIGTPNYPRLWLVSRGLSCLSDTINIPNEKLLLTKN